MSPHLAIGCFASICRDRLGDQLVGFSRQHPDVTLGIHEMPRTALIQALAAGEVAAAIVPGEANRQFDAKRLWSDLVVVALPEHHAQARARAVDPAALAGELFLVSRIEHGWDMHRFLADRVLPGARPQTAIRDVEEKALLALVARGEGVALLCRSHVASAPRGVVLLPVAGEGARFHVQALFRRDETDPAIRALLTALDPDPED